MRSDRGFTAWVRTHPDTAALGCVLTLAALTRLAFGFRAPLLLQGDSETYLGPALDLARGAGLELMLKRTPGYPLLVAGTLAVVGLDLRGIAFVQHALGIATAALAYLLGRRLGGRAAGLLAGLATALAGNLLIYERFVMTEALFTVLLAAAVAAMLLAASHPNWRWPLLAGLAIAAATLVRPVAQALLVVVPLALLLGGQGWRLALRGSLIALLGYGLLLAPWMLRGAVSSEGGSVGALGQTLVGRTARHDRYDPATGRGFLYYDSTLHADDPDPTRLAARRMLQEAAQRGSSGRAVHTRLRRELRLSEAEADRLMRDLALDAISRRLGYYLSGTLERFGRLWIVGPERLSSSWNDRNTIVREWEHSASAPLLPQLAGPVEQELPYSEALAGLFQPSRFGVLYPALFCLGIIAGLASRSYRLVLVPALVAALLMALSVALVGGVPRYRYPEDPLILAVIAVGLAWAAGLATRERGDAEARGAKVSSPVL